MGKKSANIEMEEMFMKMFTKWKDLKKIVAIILIFSLLVLSDFNSVIPEIEGTTKSNNLQYFGYYHADGSPFGNNQYIDDINSLQNSNVVVFNFSGYADPRYAITLHNYLNHASSHNLQVLINVYDCFFGWNPGGMGDGTGFLRSNWQNDWSAFKTSLSGYEGTVLGFYFDEPYWSGVSRTDFRMITSMIRTDFPSKKILSVEAGPSLEPLFFGNQNPEMPSDYLQYCTDAGFDVYNGNWDNGDYHRWTQILISKCNQGQSLWSIFGAFLNTANPSTIYLRKQLIKSYKLAREEPRYTGMLGFSFGSNITDWGEGLNQLIIPAGTGYDSYLRNLNINVGKDILAYGNTNNLFISSADTTNIQGFNQWYYQEYNGNYINMNWDSQNNLWRGSYSYNIISKETQHPQTNSSVRKWVAPKNGSIRITSTFFARKQSSGGDGVCIKIMKNNIQVWPFTIGYYWFPGNDTSGVVADTWIDVITGDSIYFCVNQNTTIDFDTILWDPIISYD